MALVSPSSVLLESLLNLLHLAVSHRFLVLVHLPAQGPCAYGRVLPSLQQPSLSQCASLVPPQDPGSSSPSLSLAPATYRAMNLGFVVHFGQEPILILEEGSFGEGYLGGTSKFLDVPL